MPLSDACGHHCGIVNGHEGHCMCPECHNGVFTMDAVSAYPAELTGPEAKARINAAYGKQRIRRV